MRTPFFTLLFGLLAACGGEPVRSPIVSSSVLDFSGHWEMDYGRSDNVDAKLNALYREWQRAAHWHQRPPEVVRYAAPAEVGFCWSDRCWAVWV